MAARRGLMLLGAIIALLVAAVGAAWMWLALATQQPPPHLLGAAVLVLVSLALGVRCGGYLLGSFAREAATESGDLHEAADPRLPRLREDAGAGTRDPHGVACPWCEAPLRPRAERCPSCGQAL